MGKNDLLKIYCTVLRPSAEYCSTVYHSLIPKYMSDKLETVQRQALKIIYGWHYDIDSLFEHGIIETLVKRREDNCLAFAMKAKENPRFRDWFPLSDCTRSVRDSTWRIYKERQCRTERTRNNPIQYMIRQLNSQ